MTPLAARMFRQETTDQLDLKARRFLAGCQFFECSALVPLAREMAEADVQGGCNEYSDFAELPCPNTAVEFILGGVRFLLLCEQIGQDIHFAAHLLLPVGKHSAPRVSFRFSSGFTLGTDLNGYIQWGNYPGEPGYTAAATQGELLPSDLRHRTAKSMNMLLEKMLCIINQPGLVDRRQRITDKRVVREASQQAVGSVQPYWHECRIRPGHHSGSSEAANDDHLERQLHYVRKYFKPSIGKWIEGYWRGNADLGVHLKWYSPQAPAGSRVAA